jgi:hypothetical protein
MGPLFALLTLPICIAALAGLAIARRQPKLGKPASRDLAALRRKALRKLGSFCQNQEKLGSFCQKSLELLGL